MKYKKCRHCNKKVGKESRIITARLKEFKTNTFEFCLECEAMLWILLKERGKISDKKVLKNFVLFSNKKDLKE